MIKDYVVLVSDGISLVGQLFRPDETGRYPAVCLCHGAPSGNPPEPGDGGYPALAERICGEGYTTFFFNFRGTGDSAGNIDFFGWTRDLAAALDYLTGLASIDKACLYAVAFSAGAATAVYVAAHDARLRGVAACACPAHFGLFLDADEPEAILARYHEMGAIRDADFPPSADEWFAGLRKMVPREHVAEVAPRPLLLVHGSEDATVPPEHARELYARAGEPKKLVVIEGAGHRLRRDERVIAALLDWLKEI
jgi:dipeptidyl aminopeptidase/acylaminoacyl peptidase